MNTLNSNSNNNNKNNNKNNPDKNITAGIVMLIAGFVFIVFDNIFFGIILIIAGIANVFGYISQQKKGKNTYGSQNKNTVKPAQKQDYNYRQSTPKRINTAEKWNKDNKCNHHDDDAAKYKYTTKSTTRVVSGFCTECGKRADKDATNCSHCGRLIK